MRIGIYNRKQDPKLPTIEWLIANNFDSFEIYAEDVDDEFDDITQREELNMLIYDAEYGYIDAVYVYDLSLFSSVTVKLFQALIELQKVKMAVYYNNGCILPSDTAIIHFQNQMIQKWEQIRNESSRFDGFDEEIS